MDEILEFINRRFKSDCKWVDGNCYYFALILHDRFKTGEIIYDVIYGHFMYRYNSKYYDWTGEVNVTTAPDKLIPWDTYEKYDKLDIKRVIRDCIM